MPRGEGVTITVAEAPEQVDVPDVTGLSRGEAIGVLSNAGLAASVRQRTTTEQDENGTVLDQSPGAGIEVERGSTVIIFVGRVREPPEEEGRVSPELPGEPEPEPESPPAGEP